MNKQKQSTEQMYKQSESEELFALAKTEEGIIILVGKFRVSLKTFKTYEEAEEYIKTRPYELIINVCTLFNKFQDENEKTKNAKRTDIPNC